MATGLKPNSRCPSCHRRGTLKDHLGVMDTFERYEVDVWQCIDCGAVCERKLTGLSVTRFERIVLAPGELENLRVERKGRTA